ncbi:MAG: ABC transporter substrate-binding protein [Candidatus Binatia bacterium]
MKGLIVILLLAGWPAPAAAQQKAADQEWKGIVEAAKKEGKVVVMGSPDPVMRNEVIPKFTARYGIPVEFVAGRSSQIVARIRNERGSGIYSMDVFLSGPDTTANTLYGEKLVDPVKPLLVLPEVADGSKWKRGKVWFADPEERYVVRAFSSTASLLFINTDHVKPGELRSVKDLLNPKWKGKISAEDPTSTGAGANLAAQFYNQLGEEFVKKLYVDQKTVRTRDRRQMSDWLARGTHPICLNCREDDVRPLIKDGFKLLEIFELADFPGIINGSPWMLTVANKAANPKAAQVFVNWMLSKEGLEIYGRGYGSATLRTDIDESYLQPASIPKPGGKYFDDTDWNWIITGRRENREKVWNLLKAHS